MESRSVQCNYVEIAVIVIIICQHNVQQWMHPIVKQKCMVGNFCSKNNYEKYGGALSNRVIFMTMKKKSTIVLCMSMLLSVVFDMFVLFHGNISNGSNYFIINKIIMYV